MPEKTLLNLIRGVMLLPFLTLMGIIMTIDIALCSGISFVTKVLLYGIKCVMLLVGGEVYTKVIAKDVDKAL